MSSLITGSTIARAFGGGIKSANVAMRGATFGNAGGAKDLILSMLTFGIYALVKSSAMEKKGAAVEKALVDLYSYMENHPHDKSISACVDGKWLSINEYNGSLEFYFDGRQCAVPCDLNFRQLKLVLEEAVKSTEMYREIVGDINDAISDEATLERLMSENGLDSVMGSRICLGEDFSKDANVEWCLLPRGDNTYDLMTWNSVACLMSNGSPHPLTNNKIIETDILRGREILPHLKSDDMFVF
ncbi:hypothetical protein [Paraburkholderia sp. RL17-373-BIF-A]|uniref:hypothetical protein n=1 Tax=Paraburkholderia sp. RL17-373-BIF-A TaxID=3031629 RepID=UPI0038BD4F30